MTEEDTLKDQSTSLWIQRGAIRIAAVLDTPIAATEDRVPLVIVMSGLTCSKEDPTIAAMAKELNDRGVATVRFDFNGHGESDGAQFDMTVPSEIEDALAVYRYVRSVDTFSTVSLVGHSQGGVVAGMLAGTLSDEIRRLVMMSPAGVLKENCKQGWILGAIIDPGDIPERVELPGLNFTLGREYIRTAQTLPIFETSTLYNGPVCIIQGREDEIIPLATAETYHANYQHSELHILDGQNHEYDLNLSEAVTIAADFLVPQLRQ
ncbi:alpha/beta hydrolase [Rhodococcus sp. 06-156-3C]|uniref:alpha/beta hydrolase n=1 Tax=Nocardiaceae TaxID=85025 RepID=UPI00068C7DEB|nr:MULTISPECIES: alpha/beta fold hydrolase [Rhodococcus]OZD18245.1 alpha/beta hydrolase [Rhodococcus sp. 06-156-4C]OZD18843.1 alpha/beta hydrolase [Rhodococcus sp. 06-156-3C]OZD22353.1 alpha/beta hydrolase [Rhodococcus sp. 06-156-4a]OZD33937.1 alpha/beta hydrolase [Rhodococcus sp. 06-156-3b]OZD38674.1 alpha/beta hydrolase [Rhodococcus sp. 06-156-3]